MKKWCAFLVSVLFVVITGCGGGAPVGKATELKTLGKDEKASIKVMYYDENSFFQQYGNLFLSKFPNIDVQVVSTQGISGAEKDYNKAMLSYIQQENPDVLMLSIDQYERLAADNMLYELDAVIKYDKFDIQNMLPSVIEILKAKGDGKLYGLSPTFSSSAVFYNKDLFEKFGVPLPKDQMSWDELLQLAKRFPAGGDPATQVYGLYQSSFQKSSLFNWINSIGVTNGLNFVDAEGMKVTMNTEQWKRVFQIGIEAAKSGVIYQRANQGPTSGMSMIDFFRSDPFIGGKAAMSLDSSYLVANIDRALQGSKDLKLNWDIVTVPVDPQNPEVSASFNVSQLFAVNAKSSSLRAAWELVKYINGDEYARIQSRTVQNLLTRTAYIKDKDGHNLSAFYKLKPDPDRYKSMQNIPNSFFQAFYVMANGEITAVLDGKSTLDDALKNIQEKGQVELNKAKEQTDKK